MEHGRIEGKNMSFLAAICGCFLSPESSTPHPRSEMTQHPNAGVAYNSRNHNHSNNDSSNSQDGYTPTVPLPRYTPRPISTHEKTLEAHLRDPPISSDTYAHNHYPPQDEKHAYEEEHPEPFPDMPMPNEEDADDDGCSSAISFPSSYGNTSTATRETPPPPYSPPYSYASPAPSIRAMSVSESLMAVSVVRPPPLAHVAHQHQHQRRGLQRLSWSMSIEEQIDPTPRQRFSWESR